MDSLLIFFLGCYGLTMILVQSVIMAPLRNFLGGWWVTRKLLSCMMCTGFWVSLLLTWRLNYSVASIYLHTTGLVGNIMSAMVLTTLITFLYLFQLIIEKTFKIDW